MMRVDQRFASRVTPETVDRAVASVPDEFLLPLLGSDTSAEAIHQRRLAYVEFLARRLETPRPFLAPVVMPNEPRRGRPDWVARRR
jgi:hypothetical protein